MTKRQIALVGGLLLLAVIVGDVVGQWMTTNWRGTVMPTGRFGLLRLVSVGIGTGLVYYGVAPTLQRVVQADT